MPTGHALASVSLTCEPNGAGVFHVTLQVWNRSYDHPEPGRRNALIKKVMLTRLSGNQNAPLNPHITDRYGIDETKFWTSDHGIDAGFDGYTEVGPVQIGANSIAVIWGAYTGIYDERCMTDPNCDRMRLQSYRPDQYGLVAYNYLLSPVTFSFDIKQPAAPKAVSLTMGHIGGNGGDPARRSAVAGEEKFIIEFP
jgi:hypothetical protein